MILKNLEKKIWDFEGFQVRFMDGKTKRDIRGDKEGVGNYNYERQAKNSLTVNEFEKLRLKEYLDRGWKAEIVLGDGTIAHGATTLSNVRDSYFD